ncbi:MAG: SatD family protein, partial [Sedimentibacter sp.]
PYIAIIGDIVNSKKIDNRNDVQIKLKSLLKRIDEKYTDDIASDFMITLGDEFQGLLKDLWADLWGRGFVGTGFVGTDLLKH